MSSINSNIQKTHIGKAAHDKPNSRSTNSAKSNSAEAASHHADAQSVLHQPPTTEKDLAESQQRFKWLHNAALVQLGDVSKHYPVDVNTIQFKQQFGELATNKAEFHQVMQTAFGDAVSVEKVEALRERVLEKDFSWMPEMQYVDAVTLQGAEGAYAESSNTIYLNEDSRGTGVNYLAYVEELGHGIDQLLNDNDSLGDEGAVFAVAMMGESLSVEELALLRAEDDSGSIEIDGEPIEVEFFIVCSLFGKCRKKVEQVIDQAEEFLQQTKEAITGLIQDVGEMVTTLVNRPFEVMEILREGLVETFELIMDGKLAQAYDILKQTLLDSGKLAVSAIPELVAMGYSAAIVAVDRLRGVITERPLISTEVTYLDNIFGSSLDYGAVNIISGGTKESMGMRAHVLGNDIFMPETLNNGMPTFTSTGELTSGGLQLLGHEAAHVWQFQNSGTSYIGESLIRQGYDGAHATYDWYHDVQGGTPFTEMNPEKQAGMAEIIGKTINDQIESGLGSALTFSALSSNLRNLSPSITLKLEEFGVFLGAARALNPEYVSPTSVLGSAVKSFIDGPHIGTPTARPEDLASMQ